MAEPLSMGDTRTFMKNSLIVMASEAALKLKGLIFIPLITKSFGTVNYGIWTQVTVLQAMIGPLVLLGTDVAALRYVSGRPHREISRSFGAVFLFAAFVSGLFSVILALFSPSIAAAFFGGAQHAKFVALCGPLLLITSLLAVQRAYLRILGMAKAFSASRIAESFLALIPIVIVLAFKLDLFTLVALSLASTAVVTLIFMVPLLRRMGIARPDFSVLQSYIAMGLAIFPGSYAGWVLHASDRLFVVRMRGLHDLGVYAACYDASLIVVPLFAVPFKLMYPQKAVEYYNLGDRISLDNLFRQTSRMMFAFFTPAVVGLAALGAPMMRLLTTSDFAAGAWLMSLIALSYGFQEISSFYSVNLLLAGKPIYSTIDLIVCAAINILLNFLLIPRMGIAGAVIATLVSFAIWAVMDYGVSLFFTDIRVHPDFRSFGKTLVACAALYAFVMFLKPHIRMGATGLAALSLAGATFYFASLHVLGFFNYREFLSLLEMLRLGRFAQSPIVRFLSFHLKRDG